MNKKVITIVLISLLYSGNLFAKDTKYMFEKTNNSRETNLCYKIATANKVQVKHFVRAGFTGTVKERKVFNKLKCNDMSAYSWADKYGIPEVKQLVNRHNRNANVGSVTITDID